jgi:hypothetical protein
MERHGDFSANFSRPSSSESPLKVLERLVLKLPIRQQIEKCAILTLAIGKLRNGSVL